MLVSGESTFDIEDLAGDPLAVWRSRPSDGGSDVLRAPPAPGGEAIAQPLAPLRVGPAGVDRSGVDRVDGDPAVGYGVGQ